MIIVICGDTESISLKRVRQVVFSLNECNLIINGSGSGKETIADILSNQKRIPIVEYPIPVFGFHTQTDCFMVESIFQEYTPNYVFIFHNKLFSSIRTRMIAELAVRNGIPVYHYTDDDYYCYDSLSNFLNAFN